MEALVAAMTLEQKLGQLHGNMETIDIYDLVDDGSGNMFSVKRHVVGVDGLGIPWMRVTKGPVGIGIGNG